MQKRVKTSAKNSSKSWKRLIDEAISSLPKDFSLEQLLAFKHEFAKSYPANNNIDAKIRQTLQILRDQGTLDFLGRGRYHRLNVAPSFSLQIEPGSGNEKSRSQISGYMVETWVEANLYCVTCGSSLRRLPVNFKVADFDCQACGDLYQVKSSQKPLKTKILGAAHGPLFAAATAGNTPNYIFVELDRKSAIVRAVRIYRGSSISADRIIARKKLSAGARRPGWQGCVIDVSGLPFLEPVSCPSKNVMLRKWKRLMS